MDRGAICDDAAKWYLRSNAVMERLRILPLSDFGSHQSSLSDLGVTLPTPRIEHENDNEHRCSRVQRCRSRKTSLISAWTKWKI